MTQPVREELAGLAEGESAPLLEAIVKFNVNNRKADILGRLSGGVFTNYASTGGRFGNTRLSSNAKRVRAVTILTISSYGAAIKAIAEGMKTYHAVVQAILTGKPEEIKIKGTSADSQLSTEEKELLNNLAISASGAFELVNLSPGPVPVGEFCSRPENIDLEEICK